MKKITRSAEVRTAAALLLMVLLSIMPDAAQGHAYPDHADPRVGSTISAAPTRVRIWFDSDLEPFFSTIIVRDANGNKVDKGDGQVDPSDAALLEVSLPPLQPGLYRVIWSVAARDGHRTEGDYAFTIK
ncbi:MAG: copper resistance protein CopC [Betaproteobacteria bacterium]